MNEDQSSNGSGNSPQDELRNRHKRYGIWSWLHHLFGGEPRSRSELIEQLKEAHARGVLDADALAMAEGALAMNELQVRDVMIPRSQMVTLNKHTAVRDALADIIDSGHSRFPVVGDDKDEVCGVLLAKDLLSSFIEHDEEQAEPQTLEQFSRPASIIPESKRLNVLLRDFRVSRNHMAIVVDEYGGVSGLITIEDVLEEIVGDIDDETDSEEQVPDILSLGDGNYRVQALTEIEDFNDALNVHFSDEEYDTIGGLVVAAFGRLPEQGESIELQNMQFLIHQADERRIHEMVINSLPVTPDQY
jgi:magnesium and cobalt transporter